MTHELKSIIGAYLINKAKGIRSALATVVKLEGSSYRQPGVRMLVAENGAMTGAVSGGCVEKEIYRNALEVFKTNQPLMMTYDGRYRLGCEGVLYILIEPFSPSQKLINSFQQLIKRREPIDLSIYFQLTNSCSAGTFLHYNNELIGFRDHDSSALDMDNLSRFDQTLRAAFRLIIFGAEHDAVHLSNFAAQCGWEVYIIASASDQKSPEDFPRADKLLTNDPSSFEPSLIDKDTAVVLMSHSFVRDLNYLLKIANTCPSYIGLLGPVKRREKLLDELIDKQPSVSGDFLGLLHGPAGLNIGAETPQEIALSILSEILSVVRNKKPVALRSMSGSIHQQMKVE